jgi:DNA (cytosine-5)-methyltransferase 1
MTLTVGSLFSGIGGLDLGLERAGMKVIWQSEIDPYACKVLKKHWPEMPNHGDIKQIDWRAVEPVDVICGGYPCQPFSTAGHRRGSDDPRHLWPYMRTAISELRPQYAILENVRGHLSMGGLQVIGELAEIGYDAQWRVVSARGLGASHQRERLIIVAYPNSKRWQGSIWSQKSCSTNGRSYIPGTNRKWSNEWIAEPNVGRVAHGIPKRMDRLRGLGNAVVPQVAEYIGRLITTSLDA